MDLKDKLNLDNKVKKANPFCSKEVIDLLNYRIEQEESSSRIYHHMSLWLNDKGYTNAAKKWEQDSQDEMTHAGWAKDYLLSMGEVPATPMLKAQEDSYNTLADIIRKSYDHEINISKQCNQLAVYALKNGNMLLYSLAHKYVTEQVEELDKLQTLLDKLETFGEDKIALKLLDQELA